MSRVFRFARYAPLLLVCALAGWAVPGQAHADLLEAHPGPNQQVPNAPDVLFIRFTERVERQYTRAEVYDENSTRRDQGRVIFDENDRTRIYVPLQPLPDGIYQVKWYSLSADTHTLGGTYLFAVGAASLEGLPGPQTGHQHGEGWITMGMESGARGVFYIGLAAALGVAAYHLVISRSIIPDWETSRGLRLSMRLAAAAAAIGTLAAILVFLSFAQRVGTGMSGALELAAGRYLSLRIVAMLLACAGLGFLAIRARRAQTTLMSLGFVVAAALVAIYATAQSSHAAALSSGKTAAQAADTVHLIAGSFWAGGLLALACLAPYHTREQLSRAVMRFSPLAMLAVATIIATGAFAGYIHLRALGDLVTSVYGRALLTKILLMVPLLALAAYNRFQATPKMAKGVTKPLLLARTVGAEAVLVVVVLLAAGVLATHPPPAASLQAAGPSNTLLLEKGLDNAHMQLRISPNPPRLGIQNITVSLHPYNQQSNANGTQVFLKFAPAGEPEPETVHPMKRVSSDDWFARDSFMTDRGRWTIWILVQFPDDFERVSFQVNVQ